MIAWALVYVAAIALVWFVASALRMLAPGPHARMGSTVTWLAAVGAAGDPDLAAAYFHAVNVTDMIKLVLLGTVVAGLTIMLVRAGAGPWFSWLARVSCRWPVWPS